MKRVVALLFFTALCCLSLRAQTKSVSPRVIDLPRGPITRIPSPDGKWTLIFECPNDCRQRKLSIGQSDTGVRRLVKEYDRSLSVGWAPDSRLFFVNDAFGSNGTESYVYDPVTLKETPLAKVLVTGDPNADEYLEAGHSYLEVKRWISPHELLVSLRGHFDEQGRGFTLGYRIDLNGGVHRLYKRDEETPR